MKETGNSTLKEVNYVLKRETKEFKVNEKLIKMLALASTTAFVTSLGYISIYNPRLLNPANHFDGVSLVVTGLFTASACLTAKYLADKAVIRKNIQELKELKSELETPRKLDMTKIKKY